MADDPQLARDDLRSEIPPRADHRRPHRRRARPWPRPSPMPARRSSSSASPIRGSRFPAWTRCARSSASRSCRSIVTDTESVTEQAEQNGGAHRHRRQHRRARARRRHRRSPRPHDRARGDGCPLSRPDAARPGFRPGRCASRGADGVNSAAAFVNLLSVHALANWPAYGGPFGDRGGVPVGRAMPARGVAARRRQGGERVLRPARDRMVPDRAAAQGGARGARQSRGRRAAGKASRTCSSATSPRTSGSGWRSIRRRSSARSAS